MIGEDPERKAIRRSDGRLLNAAHRSPGGRTAPSSFFGKILLKKTIYCDFVPAFLACTEIRLDVMPHLRKICFRRGIQKSPPVLRQVGFAAGKKPVLKSSSKGKSISWLDDVRLHC